MDVLEDVKVKKWIKTDKLMRFPGMEVLLF